MQKFSAPKLESESRKAGYASLSLLALTAFFFVSLSAV